MKLSLHKLSPSERRLALITGVCAVAAIVLLGYRIASDRLALMDATIDSLQRQLAAYEELVAQAEPVNRAFDAMASQHSSQWTQEEIHDRLRREITRLSLRNVPIPGSPIPAASNPGDVLVSIPQMPLGSLVDHADGYRSYQINFKTEPAPIQNITLFTERLQRSDQALRIDSLEIVRQPLAAVATANMRVTRTIIDDVAGPGPEDVDAAAAPPIARSTGTLIVNSGFEEWDATAGAFPGWTAEQCQVAQDGAHATEGGACARLQASAAPASFYQTVQATAGQTYELSLDATAWGAARIEVFDESTGRPFGGGETVTADGTPRRYRFRFLVSGNGGETVTLRTPNVVLLEAGSIVTLDNVSLAEVQAES
jgi:hypothetical protein